MEHFKSTKIFTTGLILLSFMGTANAEFISPAQELTSVLRNVSIRDKIYLQEQIAEYAAAILRVSPSQVLTQKQILATDVIDLSEEDTTVQEKRILLIWADMIEKKTLKRNIELLIENIKDGQTPISKKIRATEQIYINYAINTLTVSIEAVVKMRGLTSDSKQNTYSEWSQLSEEMISKLNRSPIGIENVLDFSNSKWLTTEKVELLIDGNASFAKRKDIMQQAKKSINILTWSVYDDLTGAELADLLIRKKKQNKLLKIRVIVDGQVMQTAGRNTQLSRMKSAGVEVVSWFSSVNTYIGQHRKMIVVDDAHLIAGGLNYGDVYSHQNPDLNVPRWRDTDIYLQGAGAQAGNNLFAKIWNDQLSEQNTLKYTKMTMTKYFLKSSGHGVDVSIIDHDPRKNLQGSTIMMTILKSIREAKHSIDIQNAYIILFPALKIEIKKAIQERNVKVRVLTNSAQSVDEPIVSIPILRSVLEFIKMGAEVYVKKGATLHSKLLIVDSEFSMIMSYNLHPRSERIEGEMAIAVRDLQFSSGLRDAFDKDVSAEKAQIITRIEDLEIPESAVSIPTLRLFFDML